MALPHAASERSGDLVVPLEGGLSAALAAGLGLMLAVEGAVLHLWVASRSRTWAWVITAVNVLTLLWVWREYRAGKHATVRVRERDIEIAAGGRLRGNLPRSALAQAEAATWRSVPDYAPDFVNAAKPLEPNVILTFREPVEVRLALGVRKRLTKLGLRVSDAPRLIGTLTEVSRGQSR